MSGSGISCAICKSASRSRQITMPAPHQSSFLQAGCPSCHPANSVKALKANNSYSVHRKWENTLLPAMHMGKVSSERHCTIKTVVCHVVCFNLPSVFWHSWLGITKSIRPVNIEWWGVGVVICLGWGADCLHVVQLMPLHPQTPSFLASFKSKLVLPFCYRLTQVVLEKSTVKTGVIVVVVVVMCCKVQRWFSCLFCAILLYCWPYWLSSLCVCECTVSVVAQWTTWVQWVKCPTMTLMMTVNQWQQTCAPTAMPQVTCLHYVLSRYLSSLHWILCF